MSSSFPRPQSGRGRVPARRAGRVRGLCDLCPGTINPPHPPIAGATGPSLSRCAGEGLLGMLRTNMRGEETMSDNESGQAAAPAGVFFNHLAMTVTDIARSRRFYEELLGFKFWWDFQVPDALTAKVLMMP